MGRRKSIYAVVRIPAASPPSPNATVPEVTAEVRVFYPPGQLQAGVVALTAALRQVHDSVAIHAIEQQTPNHYDTAGLGPVHNHPPYDPPCNERQVVIGDIHNGNRLALRGACLNDDGSPRV